MRRLLGVLILVLGCDVGHVVEVSWTFTSAATGEQSGCPDGAVDVEVHALWGLGQEGPERPPIVYPCVEGAGTLGLDLYDDDTYEGFQVWLVVSDGDGGIYMTTRRRIIWNERLEAVHEQIVSDGGYFAWWWKEVRWPWQWNWCKGARALRVNVEGPVGVDAEIIDCVEESAVLDERRSKQSSVGGVAFTRAFPAGTYRVWIDALDESWQLLTDPESSTGYRTRMWSDQVLQDRNDVVWLLGRP